MIFYFQRKHVFDHYCKPDRSTMDSGEGFIEEGLIVRRRDGLFFYLDQFVDYR